MKRGTAGVAVSVLAVFLAAGAIAAGEKNDEAAKEFNKAIELIKSGNDALARGDSDRAYDLYDEAITRLNGVKGKYPDWRRDTVKKQIKVTVAAKKKLEEKTTKNLEDMKQGRFRYLVWQRQRDMLHRLSELHSRIERLEREIDENQELIKDIRDRMGN